MDIKNGAPHSLNSSEINICAKKKEKIYAELFVLRGEILKKIEETTEDEKES